MHTDYDVSIIIVNYNGKKYIDMLMDGLCQLTHSDFTYEVVFVDNASTDCSVEYLREKHLERQIDLKIICSEKNLGFAGGNNLGVERASGEYIVFLNNDTKPEPDWLEQLYHYICGHSDVVMANSKLLFYYDFVRLCFHTKDKILIKKELLINGENYTIDGKFCKNALYESNQIVCFGHTEISVPLLAGLGVPYTIGLQTISAGEGDTAELAGYTATLVTDSKTNLELSPEMATANRYFLIQNAGSGINENFDGFDIGFCQQDREEFHQEYEIETGCGASIICRKADFIACGRFDEKFFMYYEDTDLSFRMKRNGGKIMYCPNSVVRHVHAGSSTEWSPFFIYQVYRNKLLFIAKNFGKKQYLKYFISQLKTGLKEKNKSKVNGTWDSLKIIMSLRNER